MTRRAPLLACTTAVSLALAACATTAGHDWRPPAIAPRQAAVFPAGWRFRAGEKAVFTEKSMVVSNSAIASAVGADIMARGGNAIDAAVATGFALAVTFPEAGNIGGGGFMVIRLADGRSLALDYREIAPRAASRNMYIGPDGKLTDKSVVGHLSVGVPGAVAGLTEALRRYGTMSLREVISPAIALADTGFVIDSSFSHPPPRTGGARLFHPGGRPIPPGTRLVQSELAWTLRQVAANGADGFYHGPVADSLVAEMRRGGGIITLADLAAYQPVWRVPVSGTYRGYTLLSMPPSSSGGITMTEALNVLETYDQPARFGSTLWAHHVAEAYQRAFLDRNSKLGDPAFVRVPQDSLTAKSYAQRLRTGIDESRHVPTSRVASWLAERVHTTHYSVVDAHGNAVATTTTLNDSYGSGVWVRGAGFVLNDEMDDFAAQPGTPNMYGLVQGEQNAVAPGKRMLSAMTPTIVLDSANQLLLVVGGAGGPTIITGVSEVILNVLDYRMTIADAMRAPRLHHQSLPDSLVMERDGLDPAVADSLRRMGHGLQVTGSLVDINAIMRVPGGWEGVREPRSTGGVAGH